MEERRVFIGLPAGEALRESVTAFRQAHERLQVRWIRPENLHVTLVPPWVLRESGPVCEALRAVAAAQPVMPLRFDIVSPGPDPSRPRLIWATGAAPEGLGLLAARLKASFGDGSEARRDFLLHLTIARLNRQEAHSAAVMKLHERVEWRSEIDALCLYESILKPGGAEYRELCRVPFSAGL